MRVSLGILFSESGDAAISIVRKEERKRYAEFRGYIAEAITYKKSSKKIDAFVLIYSPRDDHPSPYQHNDEELVFVLDGELEFPYEGTCSVLNSGDCAYFDAQTKHWARALGGKTAQAVVVRMEK